METTEKYFKRWCTKQSIFCKKFLTHTLTGNGGNQEADFLVANNKNVYFVECKERHGTLFEFEGLTQEIKLKLVTKKTSQIKIYILVNFIEYNIIFFISFQEYLQLKDTSKFLNRKSRKSFNIKEIPQKYLFTWKTLFLP